MSVVIIPAYQPDDALVKITDQLWAYGCKIVVVDDGSGDEYQPLFDSIKDICTVLQHSENRGKGAAIKTALSYVKEEVSEETVIGIMDCDGQHLTTDLMKLLGYARVHRNAMILGARKVGKEMPVKSRLGNQITRTIFQLVSGLKISDTQTGLRAFSTELLPKLLSIEGERYEYEMNVLLALTKEKIRIEEVPVHTIYRDEHNSTSHFHAVWDSIKIYKNILKFTLSSFSSFLLDYLLFSGMMILLPHTAAMVLISNIAARTISGFYNYSMNCQFVFHTEKNAGTAVQYLGLAGFILLMNNLILELLTQWGEISVYPAKLMTECSLFILSWLIQNYIIFRGKKGQMNAHPLIDERMEV